MPFCLGVILKELMGSCVFNMKPSQSEEEGEAKPSSGLGTGYYFIKFMLYVISK